MNENNHQERRLQAQVNHRTQQRLKKLKVMRGGTLDKNLFMRLSMSDSKGRNTEMLCAAGTAPLLQCRQSAMHVKLAFLTSRT
jgi:hypothetical protein